MRVGVSTLGQLYKRPLTEAVAALGAIGVEGLEVAAAPPHLELGTLEKAERARLASHVRACGCRCLTVSTFGLDPTSPHAAVRAEAAKQLALAVELAHELEAESVVFAGGRRFALLPMPFDDCLELLRRLLERVLPVAEERGVGLALENAPFGFLEGAAQLVAFVESIDHPSLGLTFDAANAIVVEDPAEAVQLTRSRLRVAHFSGSSRTSWAHTSVRRGDVDLEAYVRALETISFQGPAIYEFLDGTDPLDSLADDFAVLEESGLRLTSPLSRGRNCAPL